MLPGVSSSWGGVFPVAFDLPSVAHSWVSLKPSLGPALLGILQSQELEVWALGTAWIETLPAILRPSWHL